jgi:hypothetical protein
MAPRMQQRTAGTTPRRAAPTSLSPAEGGVIIYHLRVWLRGISPMIWRRLLVPGDHTLADLHDALQIAFGWSDEHLHRFALHGRDYGIPRLGGPWYAGDARDVRLADLGLRPRERFLYEYDFTDSWRHEIRVERIGPPDGALCYPLCSAGKHAGPPEDCGGPEAYLEQRQRYTLAYVARRIATILDADTDLEAIAICRAEVARAEPWLDVDRFDRRAINRRLQQYAVGDGR